MNMKFILQIDADDPVQSKVIRECDGETSCIYSVKDLQAVCDAILDEQLARENLQNAVNGALDWIKPRPKR